MCCKHSQEVDYGKRCFPPAKACSSYRVRKTPGASRNTHFVGDPVTMSLVDPRDGATYAALNLGHFGVKLHRRNKGSDTGSDTLKEIGVPAYPPQPADLKDET